MKNKKRTASILPSPTRGFSQYHWQLPATQYATQKGLKKIYSIRETRRYRLRRIMILHGNNKLAIRIRLLLARNETDVYVPMNDWKIWDNFSMKGYKHDLLFKSPVAVTILWLTLRKTGALGKVGLSEKMVNGRQDGSWRRDVVLRTCMTVVGCALGVVHCAGTTVDVVGGKQKVQVYWKS